jgi:hypothetical protein
MTFEDRNRTAASRNLRGGGQTRDARAYDQCVE